VSPDNSHSAAPSVAGIAAYHCRRRWSLGDRTWNSFRLGDGYGWNSDTM